jgi:hypothetical protein
MKLADRALKRLRDPESGAVAELAALLVDEAVSTPIREVARPAWLASQVAAGLEALVGGDAPRERLAARTRDTLADWATDRRPLREALPREVDAPLRQALSHPYVPREELVWRLLDQQVFRSLMSEVLEGTLKRFRKRVSGVDEKLFGGLGKRAAQRGRGLFGGVAEGLVGAVADEVESQFEKRLAEFLASATGEGLRVVARHLANEEHAASYAAVRVALLDTVLDMPIADLAAEIDGMDPMAYVDVAVEALRGELSRDDFVSRTEQRIAGLLDEVGDGTLGAWLDEAGLREVWTRSTTELLADQLGRVVATERFAGWWERLLG